MNSLDINPFIRFASTIYNTRNQEKRGVYDCRIFYVVKGNVNININSCDYLLEKDSLFYCCAGCEYTITSDNLATIHSLNFDLTNHHSAISESISPVPSQQFDKSKAFIPKKINDSSILNSFVIIKDARKLHNKILNIINEFTNHRIFYREKSSGILKELLFELHRKPTPVTSNPSDACERVIEYINENYQDKINNKILAELTNYHEYHLNRIFINHTGLNLHQYILDFRLDKARNLLISTDLPLNDIADKTGFSSASHFSYCFKKKYTITPFTYRKNFSL